MVKRINRKLDIQTPKDKIDENLNNIESKHGMIVDPETCFEDPTEKILRMFVSENTIKKILKQKEDKFNIEQ